MPRRTAAGRSPSRASRARLDRSSPRARTSPRSAASRAAIAGYEYDRCAAVGEASVVQVVGAPCSEAEAVAAQVVAQPKAQEGAILSAAGWTPLRAQTTDDRTAHDLIAVRDGGIALRIRRPGLAPDLDGWEAGRELVFARPKLIAGGRVPKGAV